MDFRGVGVRMNVRHVHEPNCSLQPDIVDRRTYIDVTTSTAIDGEEATPFDDSG